MLFVFSIRIKQWNRSLDAPLSLSGSSGTQELKLVASMHDSTLPPIYSQFEWIISSIQRNSFNESVSFVGSTILMCLRSWVLMRYFLAKKKIIYIILNDFNGMSCFWLMCWVTQILHRTSKHPCAYHNSNHSFWSDFNLNQNSITLYLMGKLAPIIQTIINDDDCK